MAIVCNALLMSWVYIIWYKIEKRIYGSLKWWLLIPVWLAWEWGHTLWNLTWPWLTIGNSFANLTDVVQWYELTGVSGGSLWVLAVNILFTKLVLSEKKDWRPTLKPLLVITIPMLLSFLILGTRTIEPDKKINVTIIQPNIDPYNTKFSMDFSEQLQLLSRQLQQLQLNKKTELVVLPETYIMYDIDEDHYKSSEDLISLVNAMKFYFPEAAILTGAGSRHTFGPGEELTPTARKYSDADHFYDSYNTAIYIDTIKKCTFYHKSKLVPGVECLPFSFLDKYAIELGGTSGSLGTQKERTVFVDTLYDIKLAPSVCYESVYGDYMAEYIRKGANVIGIITNDGWWGNTPGHRQHLSYAKLRAIESRKQIIRCANTGISCFIDEFGEISQPQPYWQFALINQDVALNSVKTFFVRFGDLISYISTGLAILLLVYSQYLRFKKS
jgi:apolipoprotein N-acyltransferase